jgi:hemolysin activation/secretion protein
VIRLLVACAALAVVGAQVQVRAQAPAVPAPVQLRFDIARFVVQGNTLLQADEIERLVQPFVGRQRDFGDVQRAVEALEGAYRSRGYAAVQVYLPEQDLEKGEIVIRVVEARIRNVEVRNNRYFDTANVRASLPSIEPGRTPNANEIARNLRIVNENPAKQTTVVLRAGEREGDVDALVDVADEDPRKWFVTLDNTGTGATGYHRVGAGWQHANFGGGDATVVLQYVTSVEKPSRVSIYSAGAHLPLYRHGASLDFFAGHSDVDAGTTETTAGPLTFSGQGDVFGARYNRHLERLAGYDHKAVLGIDYRRYRNVCALGAFGAAGCGPAGASFTLTPVSATYSGSWLRPSGSTSFYVTATVNIGGGSIGQARTNARAGYRVYRAGLTFAQALPEDWQMRARLDLQHSEEELVAPEQFGIGGANSVRGFLEREVADDRGYSGSLELYTPELAGSLGFKDWSLRALGFYDFGRVSRVNPLPGETAKNGIASAGAGIRVALPKRFSLRADVAQIRNPGGTRERGHWKLAFGAVLTF